MIAQTDETVTRVAPNQLNSSSEPSDMQNGRNSVQGSSELTLDDFNGPLLLRRQV